MWMQQENLIVVKYLQHVGVSYVQLKQDSYSWKEWQQKHLSGCELKLALCAKLGKDCITYLIKSDCCVNAFSEGPKSDSNSVNKYHHMMQVLAMWKGEEFCAYVPWTSQRESKFRLLSQFVWMVLYQLTSSQHAIHQCSLQRVCTLFVFRELALWTQSVRPFVQSSSWKTQGKGRGVVVMYLKENCQQELQKYM